MAGALSPERVVCCPRLVPDPDLKAKTQRNSHKEYFFKLRVSSIGGCPKVGIFSLSVSPDNKDYRCWVYIGAPLRKETTIRMSCVQTVNLTWSQDGSKKEGALPGTFGFGFIVTWGIMEKKMETTI